LKKAALPITATIVPSLPERTMSQALCRIGLCRRWCPTRIGTPARSAASHSRSPSACECATGFSTSVGMPAATHSSACATCSALGVARITPSGRSLAKSRASEE
jgi:hypothetical protein